MKSTLFLKLCGVSPGRPKIKSTVAFIPCKHRKAHKIRVSVTDIPDDGLVPAPGQGCFGQKIDLPAGEILGCLFETGPGQGDISRVQSQVEPGDGQLDQQGFHDAYLTMEYNK
ncbi:hypothetical protein [Desulfobacter sp.]|uniref:hypothetical protein n=1 Tax=Desulfobacter sp. TaxID=2294 RepID=UPI00257E29FA|nr:hypothetical protein [Desulfobacter sp.]